MAEFLVASSCGQLRTVVLIELHAHIYEHIDLNSVSGANEVSGKS